MTYHQDSFCPEKGDGVRGSENQVSTYQHQKQFSWNTKEACRQQVKTVELL